MKKILIISPHYPPSNLAAVHRSRLFAQHLPSFGWDPIILNVHEKYYEEELDWDLQRLLPIGQRIEKVSAFKLTKPRLIGDIGLRAFYQLRRRALEIIKNEKIDFVLIPIPSFYVSLLGPYLHKKTGVKYGIDYIDPWVHNFPGSDKIFSRHWFSTKLSKILEPIAVKHASLITGVAKSYYQGVLDRNPALSQTCIFDSMPYGGEQNDHQAVKDLSLLPYLFKNSKKVKLVYAGAILPNSYSIINGIFKTISENKTIFSDVEIHFIGTGKSINDFTNHCVKDMASLYGIWESVIFEHPKRIPYLDVLAHLSASNGILIIGSTEAHYSPSKLYQALLSNRPIFALLNKESPAIDILNSSDLSVMLDVNEEFDAETFSVSFLKTYATYNNLIKTFNNTNIVHYSSSNWSAKSVTGKLARLLGRVVFNITTE